MRNQNIKRLAFLGIFSAATIFGFQNCSKIQFDENSVQASKSASLTDSNAPDSSQGSSDSGTTTSPNLPPANSSKVTCTVSSLPLGKPTGFVYNNNGACAPASGNGPTYEFTFVCDADITSEVAGIRIQYRPKYFSAINNSKYSLTNAMEAYRGRSFYKPVYQPEGNSPSIVYGLTNIRKLSARSVAVKADFFFIDGYPVDTATQSCNNLRNWDLSLYLYVDNGGQPTFFNNEPAELNLQ